VSDTATADCKARALLLIDAARVANDDTAIGEPETVLAYLVTDRLTYRHRMRWFATLMESVAECDRFAAWKSADTGEHPHTAAALAHCMEEHADRAAIACTVLLYGLPECEAAA
jgi:hypothetical protein